LGESTQHGLALVGDNSLILSAERGVIQIMQRKAERQAERITERRRKTG
jgi:hypothetical protein